jgi:fibronectin-binding autotransporter adhesin
MLMNPVTPPRIEPLESRIAPAVLIVINGNDSGAGSLRQALLTADSTTHAAPDTILLHIPGITSGGPNEILLHSQLDSKGNVNIVGPGAGKLEVITTSGIRAFNFNDGNSATDEPVSISGISIVGFNANGSGGAIYSNDSLTLNHVIISGNISSQSGGGVDVDGNGSAVPIKATIISSLISDNTATGDGAGLFFSHLGAVTITNSVIANNVTTGSPGGGLNANITAPGTGIHISGTQIINNSAPEAGGAWLDDQAKAPSKILITTSTISGNISTNKSDQGGGGLYIEDGATTLSNTSIINNVATYAGAGVQVKGNFTSLAVVASTISGNRTTKSNANELVGTGLYVYGAKSPTTQPVSIAGSTIADNVSAGGAGGIFAGDGANLSVTGSKIIGNTGLTHGGLYLRGYAGDVTSLTIAGSTIADNSSQATGGGIDTFGATHVTISSSHITGNFASAGGGGIFLGAATSATVKNNIITGNSAGEGGGITFSDTASFEVTGGTVSGNTAANGAGVYAFDTTGTIISTTITGNVASAVAGGVYSAGPTPGIVTIHIGTVFGNLAPTDPNYSGTLAFAG